MRLDCHAHGLFITKEHPYALRIEGPERFFLLGFERGEAKEIILTFPDPLQWQSRGGIISVSNSEISAIQAALEGWFYEAGLRVKWDGLQF